MQPSIRGAWRIVECPDGTEFGSPHTHWLIGPTRIKVCRPENEPLGYTFAYHWEDPIPRICLGDDHGRGHYGYCEADGDLCFLSFGRKGVRPPRFASDCGLMFAFERDRSHPIPLEPPIPKDPIQDPDLGVLVRTHSFARCEVAIHGAACELSIDDYLVPTAEVLALAKRILAWLPESLPHLALGAASRVFEWIDDGEEDDPPYPEFPTVESVAPTISVTGVHVVGRSAKLFLATTIDIDHGIALDLKIHRETIAGDDFYIYG
jgi:hypothetical protein